MTLKYPTEIMYVYNEELGCDTCTVEPLYNGHFGTRKFVHYTEVSYNVIGTLGVVC